jgi:4,5-dihydroxyphthalate decarboxylase
MTTTRRTLLTGLAASAIFPPPLAGEVSPAWATQEGPTCTPRKLTAMMGDYPHTHALVTGALTSPCVTLDFAKVSAPAAAFARTVAMEFDISELSLVTFLMAKAYGRDLVLLPAVNLSRFQHAYLVYDSSRGSLTPKDLEHARIGTRLFTATTPSWLRGILAKDYGIDLDRIQWSAWQAPNVPEYKDPPNVKRIPQSDLAGLLFSRQVDAIVADPVPEDPRLKPVIGDPDASAKSWAAKNHAIQINHIVVVKREIAERDPETVREVWRMMKESKRRAGAAGNPEFTPFGLAANRRNLEAAIDYIYATGVLPCRPSVDELFHPLTASLV